METLLNIIAIKVNENIYLKDPDSSEIGRRIISNSIILIDDLGFEEFTFKKLGKKINSPESTIYRYFESKQFVLHYITSWYRSWLEYRLVFSTANIGSKEEKLKVAIKLLTEQIVEDSNFSYINEAVLYRIVVRESAKSYFKKGVDIENKKGLFRVYKSLVERVSEMISDINPSFKYPHMLVSTVIEGSHQQKHFANYLPSLTDSKDDDTKITDFFTLMVFSTLGLNLNSR